MATPSQFETPAGPVAVRSPGRAVPEHFLEYLELWLSAVGVLVILAAPYVLLRHAGATDVTVLAAYWKVAGVTAIVVGVLHGAIFWTVRKRQRHVRARVLSEVRAMLSDVVNNDLQVITLGLGQHPELMAERRALAKVETAVRRITNAVDAVSEESLREWRERYPEG